MVTLQWPLLDAAVELVGKRSNVADWPVERLAGGWGNQCCS